MKKMRKTKMRSNNARKTKRIRGGSFYPTQSSTYDPRKIGDPALQARVNEAVAAQAKSRSEEVGITEFFSRPFYKPTTYINGAYVLTQDEADFNEAKQHYLKHRNSR